MIDHNVTIPAKVNTIVKYVTDATNPSIRYLHCNNVSYYATPEEIADVPFLAITGKLLEIIPHPSFSKNEKGIETLDYIRYQYTFLLESGDSRQTTIHNFMDPGGGFRLHVYADTDCTEKIENNDNRRKLFANKTGGYRRKSRKTRRGRRRSFRKKTN